MEGSDIVVGGEYRGFNDTQWRKVTNIVRSPRDGKVLMVEYDSERDGRKYSYGVTLSQFLFFAEKRVK